MQNVKWKYSNLKPLYLFSILVGIIISYYKIENDTYFV